jgi:hypothetical protein
VQRLEHAEGVGATVDGAGFDVRRVIDQSTPGSGDHLGDDLAAEDLLSSSQFR